MSEHHERLQPENGVDKEQVVNRIRALAEALVNEKVVIPWPGMDGESYRTQKREEEEFPGFVTPVDEIIDQCEQEGIVVYVTDNPRNPDVYIMPAQSTDPQSDSLLPRHLADDPLMEERLAEIVKLSKLLKQL